MDKSTGPSSSHLSPADAAANSIKESIATVFRWLKLATSERSDSVENIHELRIALRRATAALDLYEDYLPRGCTKQLQRKLQRLRKLAGPVRDSDVIAERVTTENFGVAMYSLAGHLSKERCAAQMVLRQHYEQEGCGESIERLTTEILCNIRPRRKQKKHRDESFSSFAHRRLRDARRAVACSMQTNLKRRKRMHAMRIQVKALRYRLELLQPVLSEKRYNASFERVKKILQRLGDITDHAAAEVIFTDWRKQFPQPATVKILKRAARREHLARQRASKEFLNWWRGKQRRRFRRDLKELIGTASDSQAVQTSPAATRRVRPAK